MPIKKQGIDNFQRQFGSIYNTTNFVYFKCICNKDQIWCRLVIGSPPESITQIQIKTTESICSIWLGQHSCIEEKKNTILCV